MLPPTPPFNLSLVPWHFVLDLGSPYFLCSNLTKWLLFNSMVTLHNGLCHVCRWRDAIELEYITSALGGSTLNMCWLATTCFRRVFLGVISNTFKMHKFQNYSPINFRRLFVDLKPLIFSYLITTNDILSLHTLIF